MWTGAPTAGSPERSPRFQMATASTPASTRTPAPARIFQGRLGRYGAAATSRSVRGTGGSGAGAGFGGVGDGSGASGRVPAPDTGPGAPSRDPWPTGTVGSSTDTGSAGTRDGAPRLRIAAMRASTSSALAGRRPGSFSSSAITSPSTSRGTSGQHWRRGGGGSCMCISSRRIGVSDWKGGRPASIS